MPRAPLLLITAATTGGCAAAPTPGARSGGDTAGPGCAAPGCLIEAAALATLSREELRAAVGPSAQVDNGYTVYQIRYWTAGGETTGTVTLPQPEPAGPPADGWPVVVNAHGTIGLDDACRLSGTVSGAALAGLFGARGVIGVAPDYLGLGGPGLHPYLDAQTEAEAVLDAARAAGHLAAQAGQPASLRTAVVGLSQGGHAALAAAAIAADYAPELALRAVGAAAPASGFIEHWRVGMDLPGPHLAYHALWSYALAEAAAVSPDEVFSASFAAEADAVLRERCLWSPTLTAEPTLRELLPRTPGALFHPDHQAAFAGRAPAPDWLVRGADRARLGPLDTPAQVVVWQGTADRDVLPAHTEALVEVLRAEGQPVELRWVEGAGHVDLAFGLLGAPDLAGAEANALVLDALRRD